MTEYIEPGGGGEDENLPGFRSNTSDVRDTFWEPSITAASILEMQYFRNFPGLTKAQAIHRSSLDVWRWWKWTGSGAFPVIIQDD